MIPSIHQEAGREEGDSPALPPFFSSGRNAENASADAARVCRRCLLKDMASEQAAYALLNEWIAALPQENRAQEPLRLARLEFCAACDHLNNGACALCGCYVEWRAAIRAMRCPNAPPRW